MKHHSSGQCRFTDVETRAKCSRLSGESSLGAQVEKTQDKASVSVFKSFKTAGKEERSLKSNHLLLKLLCTAAIPPVVVDSEEWKQFVASLDVTGGVKLYCSTTFSDTYIPKEAARVTLLSIAKLKKLKNLTISFDGGTTRSTQSIYTIHVTTPQAREAHLIEGDEASGVSHTGEHLTTVLLKVRRRPIELSDVSSTLLIGFGGCLGH